MFEGAKEKLKKAEESAISEARVLGKGAKELEKKAVSAGRSELEGIRKHVQEASEQRRLAGEYSRSYAGGSHQEGVFKAKPELEEVSAPRQVNEEKLKALLAPKRPLTDLLGVQKEDGAYAQMVDKPCQLKFKCENCPYYDKCKSGQKVAKPKSEDDRVDEFFNAGWDDMGKGWERLG
jgi:hypothetical protein